MDSHFLLKRLIFPLYVFLGLYCKLFYTLNHFAGLFLLFVACFLIYFLVSNLLSFYNVHIRKTLLIKLNFV